VATLTFDGKEYETENMSETARAQMASIALCDRKMRELQAEMAILQTAKRAYALALKGELNSEETTPADGAPDTH
jgi:hypothetical protein